VLILSDTIPPESPGGAGKVAWQMALGLRAAGHEVRIVAARPGSSAEETRAGVRIDYVHADLPDRWRACWSLYNGQAVREVRRVLRDFCPDIVHAHNVHGALSYHCLTVANRLGFPVVFTAHDVMAFAYTKLTHFVGPGGCGMPPQAYRLPPLYNLRQMRLRFNPLRNIITRRVLGRYAVVRVAVSEALRQALEANGLPAFRVVHNGIDPADYDAPAGVVEALRGRLGLAGRRVVLFGGRLTAEKGADCLLAAFSQVVQAVPGAALLILSRQPMPAHEIARHAHLTPDNVRSGGWLGGKVLAAAYHLADVVSMPSVYLEPFGLMALEGMAASRPVVASCFGGLPEIVVTGETGFVVNPLNTETLADRLITLLADEALRRRMGQAGRRRLEDHFTLARQVRDMLAIYEEAVEMRRMR
jgi:glycosyltransferase involved in cell wall biosynthesis